MRVHPAMSHVRIEPTRSVRTAEEQLAVGTRCPDDPEASRVELQKAAGPDGSKLSILGIEADGRLLLIADANRRHLATRSPRQRDDR